jgi:SP family xylose:H+ symportor-like MFS transporter
MKDWVMGSALLGCLMGAAFSGIFSNNIRYKNFLILSALLFTISAYGSGPPGLLIISSTYNFH